MKKLIILLITVSFSCVVNAQQLPQLTQYMINNYAVNPALAGMQDYYQVNTTIRNMWGDLGPKTTVLSIYGKKGENMGLGGIVYSDQEGAHGHIVTPIETLKKVTKEGANYNFQICTHAIGDMANREVLNIYEENLNPNNNKRFRIEHSQHIDLDDIPRFSQLGVIASIQGIHLSSDRPWAINRLGKKRIIDSAYPWRKLIESGAILVNGTDAPVEPISPIESFYAPVHQC